MIRQIDMQDPWETEALWYVQQSAYRIEASLIGFDKIPPLMETLEHLKLSKETFYGCFEQEELVGAISVEYSGDALVICRMMVHPDHFRKGIASRLIAYVLERTNAEEYRVSTGTVNVPAVKLYESFGFVAYQSEEVAPGVEITKFRRSASKSPISE